MPARKKKELYHRSLKFARALLKLRVKKGDRVAYCVSNCIDWLAYDVGIMMAGAVSVHLLLGAYDIKAALAGCSVIILESKGHWDDLLTVAKIHPGGKITSDACPSLKLGIAVSAEGRPVDALLASELMAEIDALDPGSFLEFPVVDPEDTAIINQTSGTTGTPKKVKHTHFNVINCPASACDDSEITVDDVNYTGRPMAYIGGYPFACIRTGSKYVSGDSIYLNDPQNFETVVEIWKKEGCTIIGLAPHSIKDLRDFGFRVRMVASGGDMLTIDMIRHSFVFGDKMVIGYGSNEAILISNKVFTKSNIEEHRQGMIGRPSRGVEVKIVNDQNEIVELGEPGIVCVRSAWLTTGYDGDVSSPLDSGWLKTTDVAVMLPEGDLVMKGRASDFIIKGTVNLPIQLIESYVDRHPDVQKVVVVGIPDPSLGEDVCACVQLFPGRKFDSSALKEYCQTNMYYKCNIDWVTLVPSYFLDFNDFPTTPSGKLDKIKIKELAINQVDITQSKQ